MIKTITVAMQPSSAIDATLVKHALANEGEIKPKSITGIRLVKRSIDARSRHPKVLLTAQVYVQEVMPPLVTEILQLQQVTHAQPALIIGAGPAGLFAALKLIEQGIKPIVIERGKDVRSRRRDLAQLNKEGIVNPESNYCFGEGGAGTYSDGKLYTRSTKRGDVHRILHIFHQFGAEEHILYEAHPHIGTNKLPQIIAAMSAQIIACGGEVHFETKMTDLVIDRGVIQGIKTQKGDFLKAKTVLLATGHSARDVFQLLASKQIEILAKPFAIGVRIEHQQSIVDTAQYHCDTRDPYLPPASYSLVTQAQGRGVFSFCMCPGGIIAAAATAPGEVVVNGWSPSKRNNAYANSGTVVAVNEQDFARYKFTGPLAAMQYQQMVEQKSYQYGGGKLVAPAQRMVDFVNKTASASLPACSYIPGITSQNLGDVLPAEVTAALRAALPEFGRKMRGYYTNDAVLVATESRTSSPVRIPRDADTLQHTQIKGLFPCAEGAGYAGGIVSAAIDGERCAAAIAQYMGVAVK